LKDLNINGNITKSGSGYMSVNNIICGSSVFTISGAGSANLMNSS
jgi:hypothetical protein